MFERSNVEILSEEDVFQGFFTIRRYQLKIPFHGGGLSPVFTRELFVRGDSVAVLLYDPAHDKVALVRQFRIGCLENEGGPWVWEVVAGIVDQDESDEAVAVREVNEETGIKIGAEALIPVCRYYNSPGGSDEKLNLFCGLVNLTAAKEGFFGLPEEVEDIEFKTFDYETAVNAMLEGRINNAATIIALQWLQINRPRLRAERASVPSF
ncbi:MAG: NUDIX domain-containing protein [Pseudomonadales bacterium]|nr:NUDIX domain-containing protein [Pseudomonadales bacterium]